MTTLLEAENLSKFFPVAHDLLGRTTSHLKAVDDVSLSVEKGETLGILGESGCGKTTFGKTVIRLHQPTGGHIYFDVPEDIREEIRQLEQEKSEQARGKLKRLRSEYDLSTYSGGKLKQIKRRMQIVYQNPSTSLNPRMMIKDIVSEPLLVQGLARGSETEDRVEKTLSMLGMTERHMFRYPHEFSGGQRQRIAIARAIVTNPDFVVLDEPTSSVDVSVRSKLLEAFQDLQREFHLTYLFISHDLSVVECISTRVAVMYLGKIVELAGVNDVFEGPLHPYAQALTSAIPVPDPSKKRMRVLLQGEVPSQVNPPSGCRFHPRCAKAMDVCGRDEPPLKDVGGGHCVACHLY